MTNEKPVNWTEIEARYIAGELPRNIAKDYRELKSSAITKKASKKGWSKLKRENAKKVIETVLQKQKEALEEICGLTKSVYLQFIKCLLEPDVMRYLTRPILQEGEKINSLFQAMLNNATRIFLILLKADSSTPEEGAETMQGPFGVVGLDEDKI